MKLSQVSTFPSNRWSSMQGQWQVLLLAELSTASGLLQLLDD